VSGQLFFIETSLFFQVRQVSISISVMRKTSDLMGKSGDGSSPSEVHGGWWNGFGEDGRELAL
jgi:hypothetical protein